MKKETIISTTNKPFCKVCYDTGKPEGIYTSHYVKDIPGVSGKVICPTLLATECRYCRKKGHTISKCPLLQKHGENGKSKFVPRPNKIGSQINSTKQEKKPSKKENKHLNQFSVLSLEDPDELDSTDLIPEVEKTPESIFLGPRTPPGPPPPLPQSYNNWYVSSCSDEE